MNVEHDLMAAIQERASCLSTEDGILVPTDCLYPSNKVVQVQVSGRRTFTVSDRSGAVAVLEAHGVMLPNPARVLTPFAQAHGLSVSNSGAIFASDVSYDMLPSAVVLVANASKDAALVLLERHRFAPSSEFRAELGDALRKAFRDRVRSNPQIAGASNKSHAFDYAVRAEGGKRILIDAAVDDGNSINSVIVANLDVKHAGYKDLVQRIVYDDRTQWRAESLSLLEQGAPVIAFVKLVPSLERLVLQRA